MLFKLQGLENVVEPQAGTGVCVGGRYGEHWNESPFELQLVQKMQGLLFD